MISEINLNLVDYVIGAPPSLQPVERGTIGWMHEKGMEAWNRFCAFIHQIFQKISRALASLCHRRQYGEGYNPELYRLRMPAVPPQGFIESKAIYLPIARTPILVNTPEGKVTVIKEAPPIKNMIFQGGGVKGVVYPTFIKILNQETSFLNTLKEVAGSSAGSMMAFLLAAGVSPTDIEQFLSSSDILTQMSGEAPADLQLGRGYYSAGNLTHTLREIARNSASTYFHAIRNDSEKLQVIQDREGYESFLQRGDAGFERGITFKDLEFLNLLEPERFKLLHVTGFDRESRQTVYFNASTFPDLSCHLAVRSSIAIPLVIQSTLINDREITDGGEGSNTPLEIFSSRGAAYKPAETVALIFDRKGNGNATLHQPMSEGGWHGRGLGWLMTIVSYLFASHYPDNRKADAEKIYSLGPNALVVPHGGLKTKSFAASREIIDAAKELAAESARQYAALRNNAATHETYDTRELAMAALTPEEQQALQLAA